MDTSLITLEILLFSLIYIFLCVLQSLRDLYRIYMTSIKRNDKNPKKKKT